MAWAAMNFPSEHTPVVRKELHQLTATQQAMLAKEHRADGTHANITADTITADAITVAGGILELGRVVPMGAWQNVPFSAANFRAQGGATWTVGPAAVLKNRVAFIGQTCVWGMYLSWFSGSNTLSGSAPSVQIALPGIAFDPYQYQTGIYGQAGGRVAFDAGPAGGPWIQFSNPAGALPPGPVGFIMTLVMEIVP